MVRTPINRFLENIVRFIEEPMSCELDGEQVIIQFHGETYVTTKVDAIQLVDVFREAIRLSDDRELAEELFVKAAKLEQTVGKRRHPTRH
jgi:hypothetical protein